MSGALKKPDTPQAAGGEGRGRVPARAGARAPARSKEDEPDARLREAQEGARALSAQQRAAIIIALLGPEYAGPVVERMEDRYLKSFYRSYASLSRVPRSVLYATIADFLTELKGMNGGLRGGREAARALSAQLFDTERSSRIFGSDFHARPKADIWLRLGQERAGDLATFLATQRAQIVAITLSQLPKELAGEVLAGLPDEMTPDVVRRLSKPFRVDSKTLKTIGDVLETEYYGDDVPSESGENPLAAVSAILSVLPGNKREAILSYLAEQAPGEAERIRGTMLTFESLPSRIDRTAVTVIFRQMDQEELLKALKLAAANAPETLEFFYANISRRMVEQYKEQVEGLGPVPKKDAEKAQAAMMSLIARLESTGEIELVPQHTETDEDEETI